MTSIIKVDQIQNAAGVGGLTIDGNGTVLRSQIPSFYVKKTSIQTAVAYNEKVVWSDEILNQGGHFSDSKFVCPSNGLYFFSIQWLSTNTTAQSDVYLRRNESNEAYSGLVARSRNAGVAGHETTTITYVGYFDANDIVDVVIGQTGGEVYGEGARWSMFMGYLVG